MNCKYPAENRSYEACVLCSDKNICENSTIVNNTATLLSASESHKKTVDNIKNCSTKELVEVSKNISDAIVNGRFSINGDGCLQYGTIQRLEDLGYKVKTGNHYNEQYWVISWGITVETEISSKTI